MSTSTTQTSLACRAKLSPGRQVEQKLGRKAAFSLARDYLQRLSVCHGCYRTAYMPVVCPYRAPPYGMARDRDRSFRQRALYRTTSSLMPTTQDRAGVTVWRPKPVCIDWIGQVCPPPYRPAEAGAVSADSKQSCTDCRCLHGTMSRDDLSGSACLPSGLAGSLSVSVYPAWSRSCLANWPPHSVVLLVDGVPMASTAPEAHILVSRPTGVLGVVAPDLARRRDFGFGFRNGESRGTSRCLLQ